MEVGDIVCIILGYGMPVILRQVSENVYIYIGNCFVVGIWLERRWMVSLRILLPFGTFISFRDLKSQWEDSVMPTGDRGKHQSMDFYQLNVRFSPPQYSAPPSSTKSRTSKHLTILRINSLRNQARQRRRHRNI